MKILEPDYASSFRCLAGACPDTCCKDWEIILDEDTLARYQKLPGAFGDKVRAALTQDADGDTMFRLTDGHCPLLREDGLCRVQLALGEEGLCNTCRQHPRFYEEYGSTKELTLSISCPAAAKLLLEHDASVTFVSHEDGAPVSGCNDLDPERYLALRCARDTAIALVQNRSLSIFDRLGLLLLFAVRLQKLLDEAAYGRLDALLAQFSSLARCRRALSPPSGPVRRKRACARAGPGVFRAVGAADGLFPLALFFEGKRRRKTSFSGAKLCVPRRQHRRALFRAGQPDASSADFTCRALQQGGRALGGESSASSARL